MDTARLEEPPVTPRAAPSAASPDLADPSLYTNRELSILEFDRRVLAQARDPATPLLERLRFLTICSTNLDEFFEVRVAGLKQLALHGDSSPGPDGLSTKETLARVSTEAHALVAEQYRVLNDELVPALAEEGIRLVRRANWTPAQQAWAKRYFKREVDPVLTPIGLDPSHPFPRVLNKGLNLIVTVKGRDAYGRHGGIAVLQAPRTLPRLFALPREVATGPHDFVLLTSIIDAHIGLLFPGMKVTGCYQFRVTRNSELLVDEEEGGNLLAALKGELAGRRFGSAVRLEVPHHCAEDAAEFLVEKLQLEPADLYRVMGPVNLHRLAAICDMTDRPDLKYAPFTPKVPSRFAGANLFDAIKKRDVLLHHPYESFEPVVDLVRQAAADPAVVAIRQTLYRTGRESPFLAALLDAARAGKEVTALVELRARFDEAANIDLATKLQEAGANVVYGIVGYKAHAKALLVVRREGGRLRRYVHLGTGNYHARTARLYTDMSLLTCDPRFGTDLHKLFRQLTGLGRARRMDRIVQSPFTLYDTLATLIEHEADEARAGRPSRILAKVNALVEPGLIQALYRASQAGVPIDLLVRGQCALRPGVPGVSETIRVRSVIGRFLEHSRVFHFHASGARTTYCASADWMARNLFGRVETCFPIEDPELKERVIEEGLLVHLKDDTNAWLLQRDGSYRRVTRADGGPFTSQTALLERLGG
jgi:polyphosphate kinase